MLKPAAELKAKLATDEPVIGIMATDQAWPLLVEICQNSGLDYLIIDREHGHFSDELVSQICQVGRLANFPVMVRTVSCEASVIRRTVDLGPCGLLLPCVETTEQIEQVQEAALMPPRGRRRPGGMGNYWLDNYHYETWKSEFEEHFIVHSTDRISSRCGSCCDVGGPSAGDGVRAWPLRPFCGSRLLLAAGQRKVRVGFGTGQSGGRRCR